MGTVYNDGRLLYITILINPHSHGMTCRLYVFLNCLRISDVDGHGPLLATDCNRCCEVCLEGGH